MRLANRHLYELNASLAPQLLIMGNSSSASRKQKSKKQAAVVVEPSAPPAAAAAAAAVASGGYGDNFRFPLRKEPTIIHIAAAFRDCKNPCILWVDSNDSDFNRALTQSLAAQGVIVERHFSTATAITSLRACRAYQVLPPSKFRVVTNRARPGDENAWLLFAKEARSIGYNGPILLFHSVEGASKIDVKAGIDADVVATSDTAQAKDFMLFKSHVNNRFPIDHMFPDFRTLEAEGVRNRFVRGADEEVKNVFDFTCEKFRLAPDVVARMRHDLLTSQYTKHYLPRSCINLGNSNLASCIFRHVQSLVLQYTSLNGSGPNGSSPRVERVIAIENAALKAKFIAALQARERKGRESMGDHFAFPPGVDEHMHVLRMQMPHISEYTHARPVLVFHATSDNAEKLISAIGFRKEFMKSATGLQKFGSGIYFSTFPMYCSQYQSADPRLAPGRAGEICFLACWVILGLPCLKKQADNGCALEAGYDSHYALVRQQESIFDGQGNAAQLPDGDEIVVFEPDFVLPQFVIEMNMIGGS